MPRPPVNPLNPVSKSVCHTKLGFGVAVGEGEDVTVGVFVAVEVAVVVGIRVGVLAVAVLTATSVADEDVGVHETTEAKRVHVVSTRRHFIVVPLMGESEAG
jgi:hypothetical protein